jgi:hypothetical protein
MSREQSSAHGLLLDDFICRSIAYLVAAGTVKDSDLSPLLGGPIELACMVRSVIPAPLPGTYVTDACG